MAIRPVVVGDNGASLYGLVAVYDGATSSATPRVGSVTSTDDSVVWERRRLLGILEPRLRHSEEMRLMLYEKLI